MASVAICPHCYLQLVVPDGVEPDERVECPTCAKEFGLDQAVLRAIPEVVRRPLSASPERTAVEQAAPEKVAEVFVAEIVEVDELVIDMTGESEPDEIEQIKGRIEAEIAAHGLQPGSSMQLPLEPPAREPESEVAATRASEQVRVADHVEEDLRASFRNAKTVPEIPELDELFPELDLSAELAAEAKMHAESVAAESEELSDDVLDDCVLDNDILDEFVEPVESVVEEIEPEPIESRLTKPTVRTLAELMPTSDERDEAEAAPGPSFDLPNVPLTPNLGATMEIDPNMSFGPAAETEFELDDVDFESPPAAESLVDDELPFDAESTVDEVAEESEPVFREPKRAELPATPFLLPGVPRARKRRSAVRVLAGIAAGGVVGTIGAIYILLYLLGPEGDLLQIAQYLPSSVLPASFQAATEQIAVTPSAPIDATPGEESANVPAGYVEETAAPSENVASDKTATESSAEPAEDERYAAEPSPLEDEPAAEPIAVEKSPAAVTPQLLQGPLFTVEQLSTALEAGKGAQERLMAGDLSDESVRRTKGMSYAKLCDLAEALTFIDRSTPSIESEDAIDGADRLFGEVLGDPHTRDEVARIAPIWINSPHRGHGGIFLAGSVSGGQIEGEVYQYELALDSGDKLTLVMPEPLDPSVEGSSHPVGIVGSIVEKPAEQISGYSGTAERAIWVARAIPLD